MGSMIFVMAVCLTATAMAVPTTLAPAPANRIKTLHQQNTDAKISPEHEHKTVQGQPDLSEMVEVKEEDIADGTWVLEVQEPIQEHLHGESMDTASNVVFRPLFRYREKQANRRVANRRIRRRYYVPRRSYRQTGRYRPRPYRSASYYYPWNYYRGYY